MDTSAYLSRQGWRGAGHSLDSTNRGLKNPLLSSKKNNQLGIGNKKHAALSDQWWARAFDTSLKDLNVGSIPETAQNSAGIAMTTSATDVKTAGLNALRWSRWTGTGGLYSGFVKGKTLGGTLTLETVQLDSETLEAGDETAEGLELEPSEQPQEKKNKKKKKKKKKKKRKRALSDSGEGQDAVESKGKLDLPDAASQLGQPSTLETRESKKKRSPSKERRHQLRKEALLAKVESSSEP
ncbi:MAG: hypothetical protein MMC33_005329 [Icmadophila ericetorum]|nr:hypothetical protein [Icmadophila ericetorum]